MSNAVNEKLMPKQMVAEEPLMNRLRWRLIPWPMFLFLWTLVDRVNIGYAALSMNKDLGISMTWFGTIAGIFYIAYFLFEIPSNVILHRVGARKWIARIVITWGLVTLLTGFVRGVTDLAICRFLLGAMEAGFYPGLVLYFTYWFPSKHQARAVSLLMVGSSFALVVGGPIATYILTHSQWLGYAGWRWIFFAEGAITVVAGIITFFIMVDRPRNATFLSEDEKQWLDERLKAELVVKEAQRLEALTADLLDFARSAPVERRAVDPAALVRSCADEVAAGAFAVRTEGAPGTFPLDERRVRQALTNVLENARQASAEGTRPEVALSSERGALVVRVRDFGPGIAAGDEKRIFSPFCTTRTTGTGLGLAVAMRVAEMHGGTITAENHPGGGAVFRLTFRAG